MLYIVRRHLGMSPSEWDALAWWQQMMYLEGLEEEELIVTRRDAGPRDSSLRNEKVHQAGSTTVVDRDYHADFSMVPGEMSAFGLRERTI